MCKPERKLRLALVFLLSFCWLFAASSLPVTDDLDQSWTNFDQIIADLQNEISSLKQQINETNNSWQLSNQNKNSWISKLATDLSLKEQELSDLQRNYNDLKAGKQLTDDLNKTLSKDMRTSTFWNIGLSAVVLTEAFFLLKSFFHF